MIGLVLGGADCLSADVEAFRALADPADCTVIAVNDAGFLFPGRLDHWATLHPEELAWRRWRRQRRGYPGGYQTWIRPYPIGMQKREEAFDHVMPGWGAGSSGLFAVGVALEGLGLRHVVLCGVPMDARGHEARDPRRVWNGWVGYQGEWARRADQLRPWVRSMSGWTRSLLGAPLPEWLPERPLRTPETEVR